jgi:hypothetical protein
MTVWIVGQYTGNSLEWYFEGIFSTREKAIAACENEKYFICPVEIDAVKTLPLAEAEYPLSKVERSGGL